MPNEYAVFGTTYVAVLIAELRGDKTIFTMSALATRFKIVPALIGASIAFSVKMLVAVLFGLIIMTLPRLLILGISVITFGTMSIGFMFRKPSIKSPNSEINTKSSRAIMISFLAIFLPEWGDPGQLSAALLAAKSGYLHVVWLAATLAMITKALLAAVLGLGLRRWLPSNLSRILAAAIFLILAFTGILSIVKQLMP